MLHVCPPIVDPEWRGHKCLLAEIAASAYLRSFPCPSLRHARHLIGLRQAHVQRQAQAAGGATIATADMPRR